MTSEIPLWEAEPSTNLVQSLPNSPDVFVATNDNQYAVDTQPSYTTTPSLSGSDKSTPLLTPFPATEAAKLNFGVKVAVCKLNSRKNTYIFFRLCHDDFCWSHSVQAVVTENAQRLNHPRSFEQIYLSTCNEKVHFTRPMSSLI
jgi:hypothetical protein